MATQEPSPNSYHKKSVSSASGSIQSTSEVEKVETESPYIPIGGGRDPSELVSHRLLSHFRNPTEKLYFLCESAGYNPLHPLLADASLVSYCVEAGANVMAADGEKTSTLLHRLVLNGCVAAVKACLSIPSNEKEMNQPQLDDASSPPIKPSASATTLVDFTKINVSCYLTAHYHVHDKTILQLTCERWVTDKATTEMLQAMIDYILYHQRVKTGELQVNWKQKDWDGFDLVSSAARNQKLSLVWPILSQVPFFAHRRGGKAAPTLPGVPTEPIFLPMFWEWDYESLGRAVHAQGCFTLHVSMDKRWKEAFGSAESGPTEMPLPDPTNPKSTVATMTFAAHVLKTTIVEVPIETAQLCKLSWQPHPDPSEVKFWLKKGGNLYFTDPIHEDAPTVLHNFFAYGDAKGVRACLGLPPTSAASSSQEDSEARSPVDFTVADGACRHTPLHCIWMRYNRNDVEEILHAVLDRLQLPAYRHPEDKIDFGQKDVFDDFISCAADRKQLSVVWPILKARNVAYFTQYEKTHNGERIPLTCKVSAEDWRRLKKEDQERFNCQQGVQGLSVVVGSARGWGIGLVTLLLVLVGVSVGWIQWWTSYL